MARRLNILLINHYAGTPSLGMEYRPYYLAREWVRAGHRVTVVAANFSHVRTHQPQAGIPAKAGNSGEGAEDFSTLFSTLGLGGLRF